MVNIELKIRDEKEHIIVDWCSTCVTPACGGVARPCKYYEDHLILQELLSKLEIGTISDNFGGVRYSLVKFEENGLSVQTLTFNEATTHFYYTGGDREQLTHRSEFMSVVKAIEYIEEKYKHILTESIEKEEKEITQVVFFDIDLSYRPADRDDKYWRENIENQEKSNLNEFLATHNIIKTYPMANHAIAVEYKKKIEEESLKDRLKKALRELKESKEEIVSQKEHIDKISAENYTYKNMNDELLKGKTEQLRKEYYESLKKAIGKNKDKYDRRLKKVKNNMIEKNLNKFDQIKSDILKDMSSGHLSEDQLRGQVSICENDGNLSIINIEIPESLKKIEENLRGV